MSTTHPAAPIAPEVRPVAAAAATPTDDATRAFSFSMVISGIRCVLTYVIFPWVLPAIGVAGGIGPGLGLLVGTVAIVSNVFSIRRFMRSGHRWRWYVSFVNVCVIGLLGFLVVIDLAELLG